MTNKNNTTALDIAYFFLKRGQEEKKPITNKKLQKLVYYAQVWSYTLFNEKLFSDKIEAWIHGPAIPKLYTRFKAFEFNPIVLDLSGVKVDFSEKQKKLLDNIWRVYGKYDADYLETLSHSELPWQEAREGLSLGQSSNAEIDLETAKRFYGAKLKSNR